MDRATLEMKQEELSRRAEKYMKEPWTLAQRPFKVIENIYFVGTSWVSVFLIDTPDGLILVDCAYQEVLYQVIDSIRSLGFDPKDIKKMLITHGHFDHCGAARAIQEMSGCEIWLGKDDAYFFTERRDLIALEDHVADFKIDQFYDYENVIEFGGMSIRPVHCAGHTPGTTCLIFDIMHNGRKLHCGIHGGLGTNGLSKLELQDNGWPLSQQQTYIDNLTALKEMPIDVVLPSHVSHAVDYDFFEIAANDDGTGDGFIDGGAWKRMLESKLMVMKALIDQEEMELKK
ncbi:MBL fold metallo-hydrolase [Fusibacter paucivorans]|uniref:MBL fold metallo-hydrolase n=1 Tax=Fusibacter paucivorans TaxID=76009 RepID=A0ABS5PRA3_9FIRM|nr:MBL fold metallo-hydrolase [Fusibacter paucivorans]MBS7527598.1 MBL fold metallo-hydrolase [Fusibacter paucivorans]